MIDRVTTIFELIGIVLLTAAVGVATYHRFGLVWTLVALALVCFLWSGLLGAIRGRTAVAPEPALEREL